ncbi:MAG: hypothetical protein WA421_11760 [Nitrososphaeraceae archaeon]
MLKINNEPTEGKCPRCTHYQKQIARLKRAFIKADDENVGRCMKYEDKILKLKAEKEWLEDEHSSASQSKKKVLEEVGQPESNTTLRTSTSVNR